MNKEKLPIGSVIKLKKSSQKIMVVGYYGIDKQTDLRITDYTGCDYPKGVIGSKLYNFNTDEIEKCYFKGYVAQDIKVEEKEHKNSLFTISNDECEVLDEYEKKENVEEPDIKMPYYHFEEDGIVISN